VWSATLSWRPLEVRPLRGHVLELLGVAQKGQDTGDLFVCLSG
jgi:hypothetical protein